MTSKKPAAREMMRAFMNADPAYDGIFWTGVKTTQIFCRPSCPARKPKPENVEFFFTPKEALFTGYRACKRCRPMASAEEATPAWATQLLRLAEGSTTRITAKHLRDLSIDEARARRYFQRNFGMTFAQFARSQRLSQSLAQLNRGTKIDDAAIDGGYESLSGFRDAFASTFGKPPGRARNQVRIVSKLINTPVGRLLAGATEEGVCLLEYTDRKMLEKQLKTVQRRFKAPIVPGSNKQLATLERELFEYFSGKRRSFSVAVVSPGSPFQQRVWKELQRIPYGKTTSYSVLAAKLGSPGAMRAVGNANAMNRVSILIPCHRVVREGGQLGGYGGGFWRKQWLLDHERGARTRQRK